LSGSSTIPDVNALCESIGNIARRTMRKMHEDERFSHLMIGTELYRLIIEAYALSLGRVLPEMASMMPPDRVWAILHKPAETTTAQEQAPAAATAGQEAP